VKSITERREEESEERERKKKMMRKTCRKNGREMIGMERNKNKKGEGVCVNFVCRYKRVNFHEFLFQVNYAFPYNGMESHYVVYM